MYLTKKDKKALSALINSAIYNRSLWFEFVDKDDHENAVHFKLDYAFDAVELADRYGIELSGLQSCREWTEEYDREVQA
jgi:hypothetical protein